MRIALGSDHRGLAHVAALVECLGVEGHEVTVLGPTEGDSLDYPDAAAPVGRAVASGEVDYGILVCGSGIGVSMAANKVAGVRAALVVDAEAAAMTRRHNDANVLCISGDRTSPAEAVAYAKAFLSAPFDGGRHERRVRKISAIEAGRDLREVDEEKEARIGG